MTQKTITTISILAIIAIISVMVISSFISMSNSAIDLENRFQQKYEERTAFYDKMWKTISQKSQIALRNDSSFKDNINIIMSGRKDAPNVFMKWVQESNPNANYAEVSVLYQDLSRSVEAQREGFFIEEKYLQDIKREHSNLIKKFPGSLFNVFLGIKEIEYKPITSTITDNVIREGKDENVKLF